MLLYSEVLHEVSQCPPQDVQLKRGDVLVLFRESDAAGVYLHIVKTEGRRIELGRGIDNIKEIQVTKEGIYPLRLYKSEIHFGYDKITNFYVRLYGTAIFHNTLGYYVGYGIWKDE